MLDFDAHYTINGWSPGIAWDLIGYAKERTEEEWIYDGEGDPDDESSYLYSEPEQVENRQMVNAVMVGDDRVFTVDVDDLTVIPEDSFCRDCGQVGCGCNTYV